LLQAIPFETNKMQFPRIISAAHIIAQAECMNDARLRVITAQRIKVNTKTHFSASHKVISMACQCKDIISIVTEA